MIIQSQLPGDNHFAAFCIEPHHPAKYPVGKVGLRVIKAEGLQRDGLAVAIGGRHPETGIVNIAVDGAIEHRRDIRVPEQLALL